MRCSNIDPKEGLEHCELNSQDQDNFSAQISQMPYFPEEENTDGTYSISYFYSGIKEIEDKITSRKFP
jgi:hypothetical protein